MSLPELNEGMTWKVYDWQGDKFVGIFPAEGYVWSIANPYKDTTDSVSAYSMRLNKITPEAIMELCEKLVSVVFDKSMVIPPRVKVYEESEESEEEII